MNFRHLMTSLFAGGAALALAATTLQAQTNYSGQKASGNLSVGVGFAGGASIAVDAPEGAKTLPMFAYRVSADGTYPLTPQISACLSLGLDSRGSVYGLAGNTDNQTQTRLNYFSIFPAVRFSAFVLGLNIGLPMGGTETTKIPGIPDHSATIDASSSDLSTMIAPTIGAVVNLMDEQVGWLGFTILADYPVNNINGGSSSFNTNLPSLRLGLTWQFAIPGTGLK